MAPDYKNRSQTYFAVAFVCLCFVAETLNFARGNPYRATVVVLTLLGVLGVYSLGAGIYYHRKAKAQPRR
ncbi:MAG: hypothetical protein IT355_14530 [Gemmatimonadaceae bacterium]|nr:hypothetical protein [Gemmatimonadaceae bacterium]